MNNANVAAIKLVSISETGDAKLKVMVKSGASATAVTSTSIGASLGAAVSSYLKLPAGAMLSANVKGKLSL